MDVTARARAVGGELRHERHRQTVLPCHLFQALLENHVPVGHRQRLGVADVQLVLAKSPFALGVLDRNAGRLEMPPNRRCEGLRAGALEDVVILEIPADRREAGIPGPCSRAVVLLEDVVLELGSREGPKSQVARRVDLIAQKRARRHAHVAVRVLVAHVAQHERALLEPARDPQRRQIRHEVEVAVALLPVRERVALDRLHLHVGRKEIIAAVGAVRRVILDEPLRRRTACPSGGRSDR